MHCPVSTWMPALAMQPMSLDVSDACRPRGGHELNCDLLPVADVGVDELPQHIFDETGCRSMLGTVSGPASAEK